MLWPIRRLREVRSGRPSQRSEQLWPDGISTQQWVSSMTDLTPIVYVVDNDIRLSESLGQLIRSAGWQSRLFASAEEFLAHSCSLGPGCLVAEVILPGLSGLTLQQQVLLDR